MGVFKWICHQWRVTIYEIVFHILSFYTFYYYRLGGQSEAGMIYSAIGISNVIGRIFVGILCDHKRVSPVVVFTIGNFFLALNQFYCNFAQTFQGKCNIIIKKRKNPNHNFMI